MSTLTYPFLGDAVRVGQPLGCDPTGWPYRVEGVQHMGGQTLVQVEPWPIPDPQATDEEKAAYEAAMAHARERMAGVLR